MLAALQPSTQVQDDLASLFSRNLTLDQIPAPISEENKIVYVSQHYTHSAHVAKQQQLQQEQEEEEEEEQQARQRQLQLEQEQFQQYQQQQQQQQQQHQPRPSSEPPQSGHQAVEGLLRQHGVDTSGLSASQLGLFRSADDAQKLRLLQLWTICPPNPAAAAENPTLAWTVTSVEKEEILARMRLEQQQQQQQQQAAREEWQLQQQLEQEYLHSQQQQGGGHVVMSLDGTPAAVAAAAPAPPQQQQPRQMVPLQGGDGRWPQARHYMEPYMASGYEQLAAREYEEGARREREEREEREARAHAQLAAAAAHYRPSTDPVYDWAARQQAMENQYGDFRRLREDEEML